MRPTLVVPGSLAALLWLLRPAFTAPAFAAFRWLAWSRGSCRPAACGLERQFVRPY